MAAARGRSTACPRAPFYLGLRPTGKRSHESWWLSFEDDILTLINPADVPVLRLHRDEAARYLRLRHDLLRGHVLSLTMAEGLRKTKFQIGKQDLAALLAWLPHQTDRERLNDVYKASTGVALFGLLFILTSSYLPWEWGVVLFIAAAWGVAIPGRKSYVVNGIALCSAGLWGLFPWRTPGLDPRTVPWEEQLIPVVVGSLLILWGIQQFSMLAIDRELRSARAIRDRQAAFVPTDSRVVRRIGLAAAVTAALFGLCAAGVATLWANRRFNLSANTPDPLLADLVAAGGLSAIAAAVALTLLLRRKPFYREAKAAGQLVVVSSFLMIWASALSLLELIRSNEGFQGLIGANLSSFCHPYVWIATIPCVLAFNRWFSRAVERELEELRD